MTSRSSAAHRPSAGRLPAWLGALILLALACLLGLPVQAAPPGAPADGLGTACQAEGLPSPRPATLNGCLRAWCAGEGADAPCICIEVATTGTSGATGNASNPARTTTPTGRSAPAGERTVYRRRNASRPAWPAEPSAAAGATAIQVLSADMDGDGRADQLWLRRQSVNQANGATHDSLCVWPTAQPAHGPQCRTVQDWGTLSQLVRANATNGCALADGQWRSGREIGRPDGQYAVGRRLRLRAAGWRLEAQRGALIRRYTRSFEQERLLARQGGAVPPWWNDGSVSWVHCPGPSACADAAEDTAAR